MNLKELQALYDTTIEGIDRREKSGQLTEDEAAASRDQSYEQYVAGLEALASQAPSMEDVESEDADEANYEDGSALATFAVAGELGTAIATLIDESYEDPEDGVEELSEVTGHDPKTILGIIGGKLAPDYDLAGAIADHFELEGQAREGFAFMVSDLLGDGDEDEEEDETEEANYSAPDPELVRLKADYEELQAKFSQAEERQSLSNNLISQETRAKKGLDAGWLPPAIYEAEFQSFDVADDRLATFSTVCTQNKVDPETEIYARDKMLAAFERFGPQIQFGRSISDEIEDKQEALGSFDLAQAQGIGSALATAIPIVNQEGL